MPCVPLPICETSPHQCKGLRPVALLHTEHEVGEVLSVSVPPGVGMNESEMAATQQYLRATYTLSAAKSSKSFLSELSNNLKPCSDPQPHNPSSPISPDHSRSHPFSKLCPRVCVCVCVQSRSSRRPRSAKTRTRRERMSWRGTDRPVPTPRWPPSPRPPSTARRSRRASPHASRWVLPFNL